MSLVEAPGRARRRLAIALLVVILPVVAGVSWMRFAPRVTPAGQPPLGLIEADAAGLAPLRDAFNAAVDRDRLLVLLSPT